MEVILDTFLPLQSHKTVSWCLSPKCLLVTIIFHFYWQCPITVQLPIASYFLLTLIKLSNWAYISSRLNSAVYNTKQPYMHLWKKTGILFLSPDNKLGSSHCKMVKQFQGVMRNSRYFWLSILIFLEYLCVCVSHSVVSNSLRPHELQPARLLFSWNSPTKNTGVDCHSLLHRVFLEQFFCLRLSPNFKAHLQNTHRMISAYTGQNKSVLPLASNKDGKCGWIF